VKLYRGRIHTHHINTSAVCLAGSFIRSDTEQLKEMFHMFVLFCLFCWSLIGVFGESLSVMEGNSVTLNTDDTEIREDEDIRWTFGDENSLLAKIKKKKQITSTYYGTDERFRDRLKLDNQTGSLTITNTTTEHTGVYQLLIIRAENSSKTFSVSVYGISVLSSISVCDLSISLSLPLEVEYQDKNTYSCVLNNPISNQTTHLDINTLCHTCAVPPVSLILLISAGSLMIVVAAVVIFWICRKCRKIDKVETCEDEITYAETTFDNRSAQKSE
ncbi:hypothetical protein PO909_028176, partial [Leuciscus waleckii]